MLHMASSLSAYNKTCCREIHHETLSHKRRDLSWHRCLCSFLMSGGILVGIGACAAFLCRRVSRSRMFMVAVAIVIHSFFPSHLLSLSNWKFYLYQQSSLLVKKSQCYTHVVPYSFCNNVRDYACQYLQPSVG